ncbi:glycosyltransferase [Candidatus Electronema sp. PJ]|uniref:glycosyltransferase n=1 Tax=Candidatus Electronema sp. PJ TaxID=3401572 RepID=UPI003AA93B60
MDKQPLKILLLTTSYPLTRESRSGIFIHKMLEQLPADIHVTVLTPDDSSNTQDCLVSPRCTVRRFRYAPKGWQQLAHGSGGITASLAASKLHLLLLPPLLFSCFLMTCWYARRVDLIHANWSINGLIAGMVGLIFNKPVVTTLRGSDVNLAEKSWVMRQLAGSCLSHSRSVVTVSPTLKQVLVQHFPGYANKIRVIANGIDAAFYAAGEHRATDSTVRFLSAGNLVAGKGVQVILEAVAALPASAANWHLDIVGDGPERNALEAFCQASGLQAQVSFHGSVPPEQMPEFMRRADAFVFASFAEGRPNVVLEAMAAGLPVLASNIPAVQELIEHGKHGFLFPPGKAEQLAQHLVYCLNHPGERQLLGRNARQSLEAQVVSWQETASQYAALYQAIS